jgi:hypothetical protein
MKWVLLDSSVEVSGGVFPLILFLGFGWERVVSGSYPQGKGKFDVPLNSDPVNSFPTPHTIPKVPFTVSIRHILTLTAILKL